MNKPTNNASRAFRFKQFTVSDARCGMKIGTDGVLLGSYAVQYSFQYALDIGTGSGLIALMMAQAQAGIIHGVEIDPEAYQQACENVSASPWPSQIRLFEGGIQHFTPEGIPGYELIVCNPPYFRNSLLPDCNSRARARHTHSLQPHELFQQVQRLLAPCGYFLCIIPADERTTYTAEGMHHGLFIQKIIEIHPTPQKPPKRLVMVFCKEKQGMPTMEKLVIEQGERHDYTQAYKTLTGAFYLNF